jgi:PAS domain S-box-containing protein
VGGFFKLATEMFAPSGVAIFIAIALLFLVGGGAYSLGWRRRQILSPAGQAAQEELHTTLYSIGDAVISVDVGGRVRRMNPAAERLTGWSESNATGKNLKEVFRIFNEETGRSVESPVQRVLREGVVVGLANHTLLIARDGTERPIADSGAPIRDKAGLLKGVVLVFRDQSKERAAQKALAQSEERYRSLVENLEMGILCVGPSELVTFANPAAQKIFGVGKGDLAGRNLKEFLSEEEYSRVRLQTARRQAGERGTYELSIMRADGELRRIHVTAVPQCDEQGEFVGTFGTVLDITENARLRQLIEDERRLLLTLIENLPDGVYMKDCEGRFIVANRSVAQMMGAPSWRDLIGRTDRDFYPKELADAYYADEQVVIREGRGIINREEPRDAGEARQNILTTKVPLTDAVGHITGLVGISRDISELRRAQEALESEHAFLSTLMDNIPDYIYFKDLESRFILNNKAHAKLFKCSDPRELVGKTDFDFFTREHAQKAFNDEQNIIQTGNPVIDAVERETWSGQADSWVSTTKMPLRDSKGTIIGTFGISRDISERKSTQDALVRSEEHFRSLFTNAPFGIFQSTLDGKLLRANPAFAKIIGYESPEELMRMVNQKSIADVLYEEPRDREAVMEQVIRAAGQWRAFSHHFRKKDGQLGDANLSLRMLGKVEETRGELLEGFVEDISERVRAEQEQKRLEDQLQQAQKMEAIGRLAGGIAHDFNNILTVINGFSEMALARSAIEQDLEHDLREIKHATRRAATLTSQLLAFSRKQMLQPRILDPGELVQGMEEMLKRLLGEDVDFHVHRPADLWSVKADPGQIEQVVMNLSVNARDAMPDGGVLSIEISNVVLAEDYTHEHVEVKKGDYVLLAVSDTGRGMDAGIQRQIFEPFFTTKEKGKGTGLGLSTVYGIVKQSEGYIFCYSELGKGTTFKIYLPRAEGQPQQLSKGEEPRVRPLRGTETILLVEDDEAVRNLTESILESAGYSISSAATGNEALQKLSLMSGALDLLVSDVVMPGMDGKELGRRVTERFPTASVLFISGYTEDAIIHNGVLEEGVELLQKPFDGTTLLQKVRAILDKPRL